MKKTFLISLACFSFMCSQASLQENMNFKYTSENHLTPHSLYFCTKEFLYLACFLYWVIDMKKIEESFVCCDACNYKLGCLYTYGFFSGAADDKVIHKLQKLMRKGSKQQIINFLVKVYNEKSMSCAHCHEYNGWHDPSKNLIKQG